MNADVRYYVVNADKSLTLTDVDTTHVGKSISTKAIGSSDRHDVTDQYKFAEGSTAERAALLCKCVCVCVCVCVCLYNLP